MGAAVQEREEAVKGLRAVGPELEAARELVDPLPTVQPGLPYVANGDTVKLQTNLMETRMLASAPAQGTVLPGPRLVLHLAIASQQVEQEVEVAEEEEES
jgi:hypothetical protein